MLNPFYEAIAWLIVHIHAGLSPVFGKDSGASWGLSIVLLTVAMRLLIFPLFVKQIRNQRAMTALQPKMKELQAKYKNDKEKLNQEMMALWKEAGANPFAGCLPLILQMPVFLALFRVLNSIKPGKSCAALSDPGCFSAHYGMSAQLVHSAAVAKIFGVPISASFSSSQHTLSLLHASATSTKVLAALLIVLMGASTFITQRQLMARSGGGSDMPQQQKTLLYVLPLFFAVFGLKFPLGVLLYWLTTNIWSMGQQAVVIRRMDAAAPTAASAGASGPAVGAKPQRQQPSTGAAAALVAGQDAAEPPGPAPADAPIAPSPGPAKRPPGAKPGGNRRPDNRRRSRRGRR